ncbi:HNH endonuclease [Akkermansia muciniphila]|nr:HNH endonuclease [Akkermansia muciniphila]PNC40926.1 HNH endonuclease [Akkermansia muciniphila]
MRAIISYRPNTQKIPAGFRHVLTSDILRDICVRITGQTDYIVEELTDTYNKGRLLTVQHNGIIHYVTLSENRIEGRNSSLQSVPTAINIFYSDPNSNKQLWYYFLPYTGNPFTEYHLVYYRLMATAGIKFLNINEYCTLPILSYSSIDDLIKERSDNQSNNRSNNSSFITKTADKIQLYAKTYGANKYESSVFGVALSKITDRPIDVFAVSEQDLTNLPASSLKTFNILGNISVYTTSLKLNRTIPDGDESLRLRSAAYNYNLLNRIGMKKCAICGCEIPEIIQGAHIWGVSEIRNFDSINDEQKYVHATSGHNGLWLCQNHHKLFDSAFFAFDIEGRCLIRQGIPQEHEAFIQGSIANNSLSFSIMSDDFKYYLSQRNRGINLDSYIAV